MIPAAFERAARSERAALFFLFSRRFPCIKKVTAYEASPFDLFDAITCLFVYIMRSAARQ